MMAHMLLLTTVSVAIALHALDYEAAALGLAVLMLCYSRYAHKCSEKFWETCHEVHMENHKKNAAVKVSMRGIIEELKEQAGQAFKVAGVSTAV
jgi:hypothetical protein